MSLGDGSAAARIVTLYGFAIQTDLDLACGAPEASAPVDLTLELAAVPPLEWDRESFPALYTSDLEDESGRSVLTIHRPVGAGGPWDVLCFPSVADFYLGADRILCLPDPAKGFDTVAEVRFVGTVLAFWAERAGRPALHASAVVCDAGAALFLAAQHSGKTALAGALMEQGCPLLSDDIVVVAGAGQGFEAYPGHAQMRFWPDLAEHFLTPSGCDWQALPPVLPGLAKRSCTVGRDFGRPNSAASPPAVVYLPQRLDDSEAAITFTALAPREGLLQLLRHCFLHRMPAAFGWEPRRLDLLARLAESVPVRHLAYPSGLHRLPEVARAVREDLERLAS